MMNYGYNNNDNDSLNNKNHIQNIDNTKKKQCPYLGTILKRISLKK